MIPEISDLSQILLLFIINSKQISLIFNFLNNTLSDYFISTLMKIFQLRVASAETFPIIHRLEQVSSDEHVGSLAENLLEALCTNTEVAKLIDSVRNFTRSEKKRLAMAMREKQLGQLGMSTNEKGQVSRHLKVTFLRLLLARLTRIVITIVELSSGCVRKCLQCNIGKAANSY